MEYLGDVINPGKLSVAASSVAVYRDSALPKTMTQLRSLLRACNGYCRFVKDFAMVVHPFTEMTRWWRDSRARALMGRPEEVSWGESMERLVSTAACEHLELAADRAAVAQANALAARYRRELNTQIEDLLALRVESEDWRRWLGHFADPRRRQWKTQAR